MKIFRTSTLILICAASPVWANDSTNIRKATECRPAKDVIKFYSKFEDIKSDQRDSVDAVISVAFVVETGELPQRFYYKHENTALEFSIEPDGIVSDFSKIALLSRDGDICIDDPARAGLDRDEDGLSFTMDFNVTFNAASGAHSLASLKDGAKDGKSFYRKIAPGPMKFMIPTMTHLIVTYQDPEVEANIKAMKDGAALEGLTVETFEEAYVVSLEQLEDMGADSLSIQGGAYRLQPSPSIEKLKRFGGGEDKSEHTDKDE